MFSGRGSEKKNMNSVEFDFENAIDNIANNPTMSTVRINKDEIIEAHNKLSGSRFWGYVDKKGVRHLVEKIL